MFSTSHLAGAIPETLKLPLKLTCMQLHPNLCQHEAKPDAVLAASALAAKTTDWPPGTAMRLEFTHVDGSIRFVFKFKVGGRSWCLFRVMMAL